MTFISFRITFTELCDPLYNNDIIKVRCYNQNRIEIKCDEVTSGGFVKAECAPYYELSDKATKIRYCFGGKWNMGEPQCIPGQNSLLIQININITGLPDPVNMVTVFANDSRNITNCSTAQVTVSIGNGNILNQNITNTNNTTEFSPIIFLEDR